MRNRRGGYFRGRAGGTCPHNFLTKMLFFTYFTKIQSHRTEKSWGSVPPPLRRHPLKSFLDFRNRGDVVHFIDMFETRVGPLDVIGVEFRSRGTSAATRRR